MKSFQYENYIGIRSSNIIQSNSGLIWSSAPTEKNTLKSLDLFFLLTDVTRSSQLNLRNHEYSV